MIEQQYETLDLLLLFLPSSLFYCLSIVLLWVFPAFIVSYRLLVLFLGLNFVICDVQHFVSAVVVFKMLYKQSFV